MNPQLGARLSNGFPQGSHDSQAGEGSGGRGNWHNRHQKPADNQNGGFMAKELINTL